MDEHDVVEAGTDLFFGDPKSVLKKIGLSILDKKQLIALRIYLINVISCHQI